MEQVHRDIQRMHASTHTKTPTHTHTHPPPLARICLSLSLSLCVCVCVCVFAALGRDSEHHAGGTHALVPISHPAGSSLPRVGGAPRHLYRPLHGTSPCTCLSTNKRTP